MSLFIPKKIKVGYQSRTDTYSQKLAYVIYYDTKNKLRKETSWQNWRDKSLGEDDFDNSPIEGFVLNKKVGGYRNHFDMRQTYARVYDPRGFEVEITVPNLLHILEHTSCIKGKGLEGEFVYAWDGKELVLLPTLSPDYEELQKKTDTLLKNEYIKGKDLVVGHTYSTIENENFVYLGKYPKIVYNVSTYHFPFHRDREEGVPFYKETKPHFWFADERGCVDSYASISGKFYSCSNNTQHPNLQEYLCKLNKCEDYSPINFEEFDIIPFTKEEFKKKMVDRSWVEQFWSEQNGKLINLMYEKSTRRDDNELLFKYYYRSLFSGNVLDYCDPYRRDLHTLDDLFNHFKPVYIQTYLMNGEVHRKFDY